MIKEKTEDVTADKTGPQTLATVYSNSAYGFSGYVYPYRRGGRGVYGAEWFHKARQMSIEPTIAYLIQKFRSAVAYPGFNVWTDEDTPDEIADFVRQQIGCVYDQFARQASNGCILFGWQPFEAVFKKKDSGFIEIEKLKPLLQDLTQILIYDDTGNFAGYIQQNAIPPVTLGLRRAVHTAVNIEGTNWYGRPLLLNLEHSYDQKMLIELKAEQFDANTAAEHWAVYYPPGRTDQGLDNSGNIIWEDNKDLAVEVLMKLRESGSAVIPSEVDQKLIQDISPGDAGGSSSWNIELLTSARTAGAPYNDRLAYKDTEFARGMGFAERSVFEGQHGTKAEAETHSEGSTGGPMEFAIAFCDALSDQLLPDLLEYNFGEQYREAVRIIANPLSDRDLEELRALYQQILSNGEIALNEYDAYDMDQVHEKLGIPTRPESERDDDLDDGEEMERADNEDDDREDNDDDNEDQDDKELSLSGCGAGPPFEKGNTCAKKRGGGFRPSPATSPDAKAKQANEWSKKFGKLPQHKNSKEIPTGIKQVSKLVKDESLHVPDVIKALKNISNDPLYHEQFDWMIKDALQQAPGNAKKESVKLGAAIQAALAELEEGMGVTSGGRSAGFDVPPEFKKQINRVIWAALLEPENPDIRFSYAKPLSEYLEFGCGANAPGGGGFQKGNTCAKRGKQTDSKAFKKWFGDSKVVDENGEPLKVYHATTHDFTVFDIEKASGVAGAGVYATDTPRDDDRYGDITIPLYMKIENPADFSSGDGAINDMAKSLGLPGLYELNSIPQIRQWSKDLRGKMIEAGYDGAELMGEDGARYFVTFKASNVKSATGNRGTFDPENQDIRFDEI